MTSNLEQHRSETSVWQKTDKMAARWDAERWLAALAAGGFLVRGLRSRSIPGVLMLLGGGALAWWAASEFDKRQVRRGRLHAVLPRLWRNGDPIGEASEDSFPASDAPPWTTSTGNAVGSRPAH